MPRCGCATPNCLCTVTGGYGITITGTGSAENPYQVNAAEGLLSLRVASTDTVRLTLTGTGTSASPYTITADRLGAAYSAQAKVEVFDSSATWTKPTGKQFVLVQVLGGGGGGASGLVNATGTLTSAGGGGGAGGGYSEVTYLSSELPTTVAVTIGAGGTGGVVLAGNSVGAVGANGSNSSFGSLLVAGGGRGGPLFSSPVTTVGFPTSVGTEYGGPVSYPVSLSEANTPGANGTNTYKAGPSGGTGGTPNWNNTATENRVVGGKGGDQTLTPLAGGAGGQGFIGTPGGPGLIPTASSGIAGSAGGGGAAVYSDWSGPTVVSGATNGGDGGPGAGGGGGGGATTGSTQPGRGGNGGNGRVVITSW